MVRFIQMTRFQPATIPPADKARSAASSGTRSYSWFYSHEPDGIQSLTWRTHLGERMMSHSSSLSLPELEERIAVARENIRQLIEQAAAFSGAEDEDRNADRIAKQSEELEELIKQRDALLKK
jgi:hypothetical protein